MFSPELYPASKDDTFELTLSGLWLRLLSQYGLQAALLVLVDVEKQDFRVLSGYNVAPEPFNGSEKYAVRDVILECFQKYPKAHVHNIDHLALSNLVKRFSKQLQGTKRVWFLSSATRGMHFVFLGFPKHDDPRGKVPDEFAPDLNRLLLIEADHIAARDAYERLRVTESFVKEVGHDIAASVQATLAKARSIKDGRVRGTGVAKKAAEIEREIMEGYRIAESLSIAVDRNYKVQELDDFDLQDCVRSVVSHYSGEAAERHMELALDAPNHPVPLWGDKKAIQQCIGNIIMNAIKYGQGGTVITLKLASEIKDFVKITISNRGTPLPSPPERDQIWDFGFRGKDAKEMHVNGSGIGLYTVRKIVRAHYGQVTATSSLDRTVFELSLPEKHYLKNKLNLLI